MTKKIFSYGVSEKEMFPLKYKTAVCFLSANTKQYVSYRITKLCFHLANTKQYVSYRKTKDAKDMFPIEKQKIMFPLGNPIESHYYDK